nr:leader peptide SpeFL [Serratia oryzae]
MKDGNNNRKMAHIRRTTHMMMAHRSCFSFAFFNFR